MSRQCADLHGMFAKLQRFAFPLNSDCIPKNGMYVLFEKGETAHGGDRIVRIGTHTGDNQLHARLIQHFVSENKDRSIFRKNIGRALLNKEGDSFLEQWEYDLTARAAKERWASGMDFVKQHEIEKRVTKIIQDTFTFVIFEVADKNKRLELESKLISTISLCDECQPSKEWFGLFSPKKKIAESGLWLVNELYKNEIEAQDIETIQKLIK